MAFLKKKKFIYIVLMSLIVSTPNEIQQAEEITKQVLNDLRSDIKNDILGLEQPDEGITLPDGLSMELKYDDHYVGVQYVLVRKSNVAIRATPSTDGKVLKKPTLYERFTFVETIECISKAQTKDQWVHVMWSEGGSRKFGFVSSDKVTVRKFRFADMYKKVLSLEKEFFGGTISYVNNYKNMTGTAPTYKGGEVDKLGNNRDQSSPAYNTASVGTEFTYVRDGNLLKVMEKQNAMYKVKVISTGKTCWIPEKYVPAWKKTGPLTKAVVIDLKNQTEVLFEKIEGQWTVVSYTLATTGAKAEHKLETPVGSYFAIEKRDKFMYLNDVTKEVDGYAPYAVRFTGGAYIHGVPVKYKFQNGRRIDPGMIETSRTLGTIPLSHQCVRNFTSHAKFVRDWTEVGRTAIIVIE